MKRLDKKTRLELGRRYALKEITLDEAVKTYGVHKSTVWVARKDWLARGQAMAAQAMADRHDELQQGFGDVEKPRPEKNHPERPPVDHAYVATLEEECTRLNTEVRTLQKIVMTLGRAL